ncbi:hypothetical protein SAMN06296386_10284 [Lachnospiraceae bacterium]|nr:hypothetical protein SAMN06296386_10284 [Lachnospiraceae bacterium]
MFIEHDKRILSKAISVTAVINTVMTAGSVAVRFLVKDTSSVTPDMLNDAYWTYQIFFSVLQIFVTAFTFWCAWRQLDHYRKLVPVDDYTEMAKLQEEVMPDEISNLSSYSIRQLLEVWAFILIGVRIVYDIFTITYRRFVAGLSSQVDITNVGELQTFSAIYNGSHSFKYIGMLIALVLGILITGVFLNDKYLKIAAVVLTVLFIISATLVQIQTYTIFDHEIAIVWSSVIFHLLQTVGLLALGIYLKRVYRGV